MLKKSVSLILSLMAIAFMMIPSPFSAGAKDSQVVPVLVYDQCNPVVGEYMDNVEYDPDEPSVSRITEFSEQGTDYRKDRPVGATVHIPEDGTLLIRDFRGSVSYPVSSGDFTIKNLTPGKIGTYVLFDQNDEEILRGYIRPTGSLRMIDLGTNTFNIRDIGGWQCDGGTLKYGLIYRGCEIDSDNYNINLTEMQKRILTDFLNIRDDIDLRADSEVDGEDMIFGTDDDITDTPLGDKVDYVRYPILSYERGINLDNKKQTAYYAALIKRIAADAAAGKPCYIHCMAGADRSGTVCALIEALCGVSRSDIDKDYELTSFAAGNLRQRTSNKWIAFIDAINAFPGETFCEKATYYALQAGVTADEISALRKALIEKKTVPDLPMTCFLGDADNDKSITIIDATLIMRFLAELDTPSDIAKITADVDRDDLMTIIDATVIQRWLADYTVAYPVGEEIMFIRQT